VFDSKVIFTLAFGQRSSDLCEVGGKTDGHSLFQRVHQPRRA
jgi:hypothetical protein